MMRFSDLEFTIPVGQVELTGWLAVPPDVRGLVIVPLRSSEGRDSEAARAVAESLLEQRFSVLLLDLLTVEEQWIDDAFPRQRFGDAALGQRLREAVAKFREDVSGTPLTMAVLAMGAARSIVVHAALPVPTIVSRAGTAPELQGPAYNDGDWSHRFEGLSSAA